MTDPSAVHTTSDLAGMLLSGGGGTLGGAAGTLLLLRVLGHRQERNGNGGSSRIDARMDAFEGKMDEMVREQQETNKLLSTLTGYLQGIMSQK